MGSIVKERDVFRDLDRKGPMPIYFQIASCIERAILDGRLPAGARLDNGLLSIDLVRPKAEPRIQTIRIDSMEQFQRLRAFG